MAGMENWKLYYPASYVATSPFTHINTYADPSEASLDSLVAVAKLELDCKRVSAFGDISSVRAYAGKKRKECT